LTVISNTLALTRVDLKKKVSSRLTTIHDQNLSLTTDFARQVIGAPEVTQVLVDLPILGELMQTLYPCSYAQFFIAPATLEQTSLLPSRMLVLHARYYMREMRQKAHSQLLESYSSLTIDSLSAAFRVSNEFVDRRV
jgi:26S proteasome regulatory subunit N7